MRQYSVPITFCSAYGDSGLAGMSSRFGSVGEVPLHELHARNVIEIAALAGAQVVGDPDAVPPAYEFFRQMRSNEPGAARDKVRSHNAEVYSKSQSRLFR